MAQPSVTLTTGQALEGESVVLSCFARSTPDAGRLSRRLTAALRRVGEPSTWKTEDNQVERVSTGGPRPVQVEVYGLGSRSGFDERRLAIWLGKVLQSAGKEGRKELTIVLPDQWPAKGSRALRVVLELLNSGYRYDRFQSKKSRPSLRKIYLLPPAGEDEVYENALRLARPISRGVKLSRDLANTPPNEATPEWMAAQAEQLSGKRGIDCQILLPEEMQEMGMGGILAVGRGSKNPPRLVKLSWGEGDELTSLVGKGVTFDTGGISLKPSASMEEMKYDKCGACSVLGIASAVADLRLAGRFQVYVPLVENMPDGGSYRPSDIVRCYNGKTVEILDTDAEGRMILADALAWAAEGKPNNLLEMSTLTGASVIALGNQGAALYAPNDGLADELLQAASSSGERLWRMPMWPEFQENMKGVHADLRNLGTRWGSANSAAAFLGNFVGQTKRWAHLDIAGTAYQASREGQISGATGFGVSLVLDWLLQRAGRL